MITNRDFEGIEYHRDAGGGVRVSDFREKNAMNNVNNLTGQNAGMYVPEDDVIKILPDGRQLQAATAGVPMLTAEAVQLGLIDEDGKTLDENGMIYDPDFVKEQDKKSKKPNANKSKAPAENK